MLNYFYYSAQQEAETLPADYVKVKGEWQKFTEWRTEYYFAALKSKYPDAVLVAIVYDKPEVQYGFNLSKVYRDYTKQLNAEFASQMLRSYTTNAAIMQLFPTETSVRIYNVQGRLAELGKLIDKALAEGDRVAFERYAKEYNGLRAEL